MFAKEFNVLQEEDECPRSFMVKVGGKQEDDSVGSDFVSGDNCKPVRDAAFPECNKKIEVRVHLFIHI